MKPVARSTCKQPLQYELKIDTPIRKITQRPPPKQTQQPLNILRTAPAIVVECSRFTDPEPFVFSYTNYMQFHEENPQEENKKSTKQTKNAAKEQDTTEIYDITHDEPKKSESPDRSLSPPSGKQELSSASSTSSPESEFFKPELLFESDAHLRLFAEPFN
mmetsp:Transcript_83218/g.124809  ORF Transcript_83218/g.124809 Transcript_83218/m.124809 type:complete len:161 (-) Transcript_83218:64-546(-)